MADFQRRAADRQEIMKIAASMVFYDPVTGEFKWRENSPRAHLKCGILDDHGYIRLVIGRSEKKVAIYVRAHRLAWFISTGYMPKGEIDHINQVRSDNRISNLRDVSKSMNQRNITRNKNNTSGFPNVCRHKASGKWIVQVRLNKKNHRLGMYDDIAEADRIATEFKAANGFTENHGRLSKTEVLALKKGG